jgi:hypothetical protein
VVSAQPGTGARIETSLISTRWRRGQPTEQALARCMLLGWGTTTHCNFQLRCNDQGVSSSSSRFSEPSNLTPSSLSGKWFMRGESGESPPSGRSLPPSLLAEVVAEAEGEAEGQLTWAVGLGLFAGALGGAAMIGTANAIARQVHLSVDILQTIGGITPLFGESALRTSLVLGGVVGALVGAGLGALMRYSLRLTARVLSGLILAPALWTLAHAFLIKPFAPSLRALPFGPMVAGALVYGLCIALVKPPRGKPDATRTAAASE